MTTTPSCMPGPRQRSIKTWKEISGREHRLVGRPVTTNTTSVSTPYRGTRVTPPGSNENWATYTPKSVAKPVIRIHVAANDNRRQETERFAVRRPNDGPSDEHRAAVAAAGHATDHGLAGTRIERALRGNDNLRQTYMRARELFRPTVQPAANDDDDPEDDAPFGKGVGHETYQRIRPSIGELLAAYADGMRPRILTEKRRDSKAAAPGRDRAVIRRFGGGIRATNSFVEVGGRAGSSFVGLQFRNGELVAFSDSAGRRKRPWVDATRDSRATIGPTSATATHIRDAEHAASRVLRLTATSAYEPWRRGDGPIGLPATPTTRAAKARAILDRAYASGANLSATTCRSGVADDYGLIAGFTEAKGVGKGRTSAPQHEALAEMNRQEDADDLRGRIDENGVRVLDALLDADTFKEIGTALGYAEGAAHRHGRVRAEKILDEIEKKLAA